MPKQTFRIMRVEQPAGTAAGHDARDFIMTAPPLAGTAPHVGGGITGNYGSPAEIAEADAPYTETWTGLVAQSAPPPFSRRHTSGAP